MRTKSAQASAVLANVAHTARIVMSVADSGGTLQPFDESDTPILSVRVEESVDAVRTCTVSLQMAQGLRSRSPFNVGASNPLQPSAATVMIGREVLISAVLTPDDASLGPITGLSVVIFSGFIDEVQAPGPEMEITCTDQSAKLRDTWIERERVYGLCTGANATRGAFVWAYDLPNFAVNDLVIPSELNANGHFYKVTSGTAAPAATEPVWPTGSGSTVVSNGVTFTEAGATSTTGAAVETVMQQILTDNVGASALSTLTVPASPSWVIKPYIQQRTSVLEALQQFSTQLGWRLAYVWNTGSSLYALTLYVPDRARVTVDLALAVDQELECTELGVDVFSIRNVVQVVYGDGAVMDPDGTPWRKTISVSDSASITKYGRRFMEIAEADVSAIDSSSEATALANAVLSDLKEPLAGVRLAIPIDPYVEIGDMVQVPADGRRFSSAQLLAIEALDHDFTGDQARTTLTLRGQPVAQRAGWLKIEGRMLADDVHLVSLLTQAGQTLTRTPIVAGAAIDVGGGEALANGGKKYGRHMEIHVSESAGFTPTSGTKRAAAAGRHIEIAGLIPGKTYYQKTIPYIENADRVVRGSPSVEASFVAGRTKQIHYDSSSTQSHLPLNGNFEHLTDNAVGFDHWAVTTRPSEATETWGGSVSVNVDTDKGNCLFLTAAASQRGNVVSSAFEVRRGIRSFNIYLSILRGGSSAASGKDLIVDIFGFSDAALTTQIINYSVTLSGDSAGPYPSLNTWYPVVIDFGGGYGTIPENVNFLQIGIRRGTTGNATFSWMVGDVYVQEADFYRATIDQPPWVAVSFANSFADFDATNYQPTAYMKDSLGFIHLRGMLKRASAALSTTIFTLASGYRPAKLTEFMVNANGRAARLEIASSGTVQLVSADDASWFSFVSLDGLTFDTR